MSFPLQRFLVVAIGLLLVPLAVAVVASSADTPPVAPAKPATPTTLTPYFAKAVPAENKSLLILQSDTRGIHGWVAGARSFAGKEVVVTVGDASESVRINADNTFTIRRNVNEPMTLTATLVVEGEKSLKLSTLLLPSTPSEAKSVFFVTDRSAYRPGHTLKFAAFLRTFNAAGEFEPVRKQAVRVDLTSNAKGTKAAQISLLSDEFGRVNGTYTFSNADALDDYTLSIENWTGTGTVRLGEYRKTKVGLTIAGEVNDGKLHLTFQTKDYLGRGVKGANATYTAEVSRTGDAGPKALDPSQFAHPESTPPTADDFAKLPDDERLIALAQGVSATTFNGLQSHVLATRSGAVTFTKDEPGKVTLDLNPEWLKGNHSITITGVLVDETGRESRSTATIPLSGKPSRGVNVNVPSEIVPAGLAVPVTLEPFGLTEKDAATTTLLVVKLTATPGMPLVTPTYLGTEEEEMPDGLRLPAIGKPRKGERPVEGWSASPVYDPVRRTIVTALPVVNNKATLDLKKPGAYKLVAITRLADGTVLQSEAGLAVKNPDKLPTLILDLASNELKAGDSLRGVIHSKFANAKLLLTLRDSAGIRHTKTMTTGADGVAKVDEPLPKNLRYGCTVSVQYPETATLSHIDHHNIFVDPTDRTVAVTATAPATVGPGEEVPVTIDVHRAANVDLIVSVYDESLLAVTGDLQKNIRNHFLADVRGHNDAAREAVIQRVGGVTVGELLKKAKALLADTAAMEADPALRTRLQLLVDQTGNAGLSSASLVTLLQLAGQEVLALSFDPSALPVEGPSVANMRLADMLRAYTSASFALVNDVVVVGPGAGYSLADPWQSLRHPMYGYGFGGFPYYYGFQGGFGGFGGGGFGGGALGGGRPSPLPSGNGVYSGFQGGFSLLHNTDFVSAVKRPAPGTDAVRRDFADSAYWSAHVRTDAAGKATVKVPLPDSLTTWRVSVTAVTSEMHVGTGTARVQSKRPVMIWPMLPRAFTDGDTVRVFGTVHNLTDQDQTILAKLTVKNGQVFGPVEKSVIVPPNGSRPVEWDYRAGSVGTTDILMAVESPAGKDASLKVLPVSEAGVRDRVTASGLVGKGQLKFTMPDDFDPKTATVSATITPSLAADMADTLNYLVEYPYGCVEQTMSRFLPALRVAQILKQSGISMPELEAKLPKVVEAGVKRLLELQQPDGGWGWHGGSQTHEMMTPYALLGLLEAKKAGYPIPNEQALSNGAQRLKGFLQSMGATWDQGIEGDRKINRGQLNDSLYCLWVLSRAEAVPVEWWKRIDKYAGTPAISDYGHALALELAAKGGPAPLREKLAAELHKRATKVDDRIYWTTAGFSRWPDNTTEVTAAVLKALVANAPDDAMIPGILTHFHSTKRGDRWDSTKDTAAVLYAVCDYLSATKADPARTGKVVATLNGSGSGSINLSGPFSKTIALPATDLKPGENLVAVTGTDTSNGSLVRVVVKFGNRSSEIPARDHGIKVTRTISVKTPSGSWEVLRTGAKVPKGSYLKIAVAAESQHPMSFALIESPKPATGETVPADDKRFPSPGGYSLREDRETMGCFHYEQHANAYTAEYVVLAEFAGKFRLPPARAEMMYRPTHDGHSDSFDLIVE